MFLCKQEIEADNLNLFQHSEKFLQPLPQLESPSLPLLKRPTMVSIGSVEKEDEEQTAGGCNSSSNTEKVTDWRALDKFVASQLSQGERCDEGERGSNLVVHQKMDMSLLLPQSRSREEGDMISIGCLSSGPDCDIGICIFEK